MTVSTGIPPATTSCSRHGRSQFSCGPRCELISPNAGQISSCQYVLLPVADVVSPCFGPGEGGGAQVPGEYGLVGSRHEREGGVFRVNYRSGEMSICYVFEEKVVCTPQASPGAGPAGPTLGAATPGIRGAGASPQRP